MTDARLPTKFDIIILGDGLASRIAATLLAKNGRSVLHIRPEEELSPPSWLFSGRLYERLLETLDGRSCLEAATPLQVLTPEAQIEFHGKNSLAEELTREFRASGERAAEFFKQLSAGGEKLEAAIWECGLPLFGAGSRWRFFWARVRLGLAAARLKTPLTTTLSRLEDPKLLDAFEALFSGLTDQPLKDVTTGEAMLVASALSHPLEVNPSRFLEFLDRRFDQFHGRIVARSRLKSIESRGGRIESLIFAGNTSCSAGTYLLGDQRGLPLPAGFASPAAGEVPSSPLTATVRPESGQLGPLLAPRVVLAGEPALRLSICRLGPTFSGRLEMRADSGDSPDENALRHRLADILPFVDYDLDRVLPGSAPKTGSSKSNAPFPGAVSTMKIADNLLAVYSPALLPTLAGLGEAAVGVAAFRHFIGHRRESR